MTRMLSSARTHCGVSNVFGPNAAAVAIAHPNSRLFHTSGVGDMASGLFLDGQFVYSCARTSPGKTTPARAGTFSCAGRTRPGQAPFVQQSLNPLW